MKLIAFVEGRPKPLPRTTVRSKFLFSKSVEQWAIEDAKNAERAALGMINKKGNPYKPTRYAYRLSRLQKSNEFRDKIKQAVLANYGPMPPTQDLFVFFMFKTPKSWSKKKAKAHEFKPHLIRPDVSNTYKLLEDSLYEEDSMITNIALYKMYVPVGYKEGIYIFQDADIHNYIIEIAKELIIDLTAQ